jgi:CheY-like chemotaxis protein
MDGLEAASKIMELNTGVPIVAMTANIMYNDREIYKKSGIFDCVGKPFTNQELWRCLMKYLTPQNTNDAGIYDENSKFNDDNFPHVRKDWEYQKELQELFVQSNHNKYDKIIDALESGDIKLAHRLAHSLNTNACQVGKIILQKAASDIEFKLKDGKNQVTDEQLAILKSELDMVLNEFNTNIY